MTAATILTAVTGTDRQVAFAGVGGEPLQVALAAARTAAPRAAGPRPATITTTVHRNVRLATTPATEPTPRLVAALVRESAARWPRRRPRQRGDHVHVGDVGLHDQRGDADPHRQHARVAAGDGDRERHQRGRTGAAGRAVARCRSAVRCPSTTSAPPRAATSSVRSASRRSGRRRAPSRAQRRR